MQTRPLPTPYRQHGLTLIELMVAMVIGLIMVLAATAALLLSRQGFNQVDAASQLRDNARFATSLIERLSVQTGYRDLLYAATSRPPSTLGMTTERPNIFGFDNRTRSAGHKSYEASSSPRAANSLGYGSDILVLRFQAAATDLVGSTDADKAMIDCMGHTPDTVMNDRYERYSSIFHIADRNGEPTLMCTRWPQADDYGTADTQPLITGVENFQVLYGIDTTGKSTTLPDGTTVDEPDSVVDQYLPASQITDASNPALTLTRWQQVRSLRIGMILRSAPGTAIGDTSATTLYPFGNSTTSKAMFASNSVDPGSVFTPPNDGRLRQVVTFTVHLRNPQGDE